MLASKHEILRMILNLNFSYTFEMVFVRKTKLPSKIKPDFVQDDLDSQFPQYIESIYGIFSFAEIRYYVSCNKKERKRRFNDVNFEI